MADQISPKIINYLKNEKEFLIPIRKIWLNVLTVEERFKISFDKLVSRLETDDRFRVFKSSINEDNAPALCVKHETLIKRPVLVHNEKLYIGFSDKLYNEIFNP